MDQHHHHQRSSSSFPEDDSPAAEDDDDDDAVLPEMSQECVMWDEGTSHVDLRRLASPSFQTPGAASASSSLAGGGGSSSNSSREERRSSVQPQQQVATHRYQHNAQNNRASRPSLLEITRYIAAQEDIVSSLSHSTTTTTDDEATTAMVSRKRRRRQNALRRMTTEEETESETSASSKSTTLISKAAPATTTATSKTTPCQSSSSSVPQHTPQPIAVATAAAVQVGDDEFASLLQQVKTPSPHPAPDSHLQMAETTATTVNHLPVHIHKPSEPLHETTPQAINTTTTSIRRSSRRGVSPKDNDEFGDLDLSLEDIAMMDALALQATQTTEKENVLNQQQQQIESCVMMAACQHSTEKVALPPTHHQEPQKQQQQTCQDAEKDDDEFGDFPMDFDFDALDQSITQQCQPLTDPYVAALSSSTATSPPPTTTPIRNPRTATAEIDGFISYSRYKIMAVQDDGRTFTKALSVTTWRAEMLDEVLKSRSIHKTDEFARSQASVVKQWPIEGVVYLRGEWYHTHLQNGDIIHICSLSGQFRTDVEALPLLLHTVFPTGSDQDDLMLIVHPDMLLTPTVISETVSCSRRAVLKNRLGSTGLTTRAPLFGTMRHQLFEATMKEKEFHIEFIRKQVSEIVRDNAEGLLACDISPHEAELELIKFAPQLQLFASQYTVLNGRQPIASMEQLPVLESCGTSAPVRCRVEAVDAVEEPVVSPELGLKGNIDMLVKAAIGNVDSNQMQPFSSTMVVELKTGHFQSSQHAHLAQLALYMIMLRSRYVADYSRTTLQTGAVGKGMLLYMNNEAMRAVHTHPSVPEIKSLLGQRNIVAIESLRAALPRGVVLSYQNARDCTENEPKIELMEPTPAILPPLLNGAHMCQKCYSNRECMMYAAAEASSGNSARFDSHKELLQVHTGNLEANDLAYFQKFDRLIDLEADAGHSLIAQTWLVESSEREKDTAKCISRLTFDPTSSVSGTTSPDGSTSASVSFKRSLTPSQAVHGSRMEPGNYVIVSCDTTTGDNARQRDDSNRMKRLPMHLIRGIIESVSETSLSIRASVDDLLRIEKVISSAQSHTLFRMDIDDIATGITTLRQNLVNFFTADQNPQYSANNRLSRLRDSIVRLKRPMFDDSMRNTLFTPPADAALIPGCDCMDLALEYADMNPDQQAAINAVFSSRDYTLIQGFPGSGKTSTIAFVVRLLVAHGKRVLVTSYTNAAVDNVLLKLMEKGVSKTNMNQPLPALVRVGRPGVCHSGVESVLTPTIALNLEKDIMIDGGREPTRPSASFLRRTIESAKVVGVTALSAPRSPQLLGQHFDVVIVDEAGQISQPAIIGALIAADSFVLVGDHMQLPPLVSSELAERGGYGVSMLKLLADAHPDIVAKLSYQYRMNEEIAQLSNDLVYDGALKCANDMVRNQVLSLTAFPESIQTEWLRHALEPSSPVVFVNTDYNDGSGTTYFQSLERTVGGKIINYSEVQLVRQIVRSLMCCGIDAGDIGVICPFRAQVQKLDECEELFFAKSQGLEISTIDRYQGRDKRVIILSFVRSNEKKKVGRLLDDSRRLNVAVSRAKCKLIMVGSFSTIFHGSKALKPALCRLKNRKHVLDVPREYMHL